MTQEQGWHLSKNVNIGVILTLGLNTIATIWWAANIDTQVRFNHEAVVMTAEKLEKLEDRQNVQMSQILNDITRIKTILEFADVEVQKKN